MSTSVWYPLRFPAISVTHPLGEFYLASIPARVLLQVTYSDVYTRLDDRDVGHQRKLDPKRVKSIERYIETRDAVFPGTIILAANCRRETGLLPEDDAVCWRIEPMATADEAMCTVVVPTDEPVVAVVDGQHRLNGFREICEEVPDMSLPCAIFIGLSTPQQAALFATINYNQKPVSKSITYELFGCSIDDEAQEYWPPEKLAVFLARRLAEDDMSPFRDHVKVAAVDGRLISSSIRASSDAWLVSMATVVEGILALITRNAVLDRDRMLNKRFGSYRRSELAKFEGSGLQPPLRELYIQGDKDPFIYKMLLNYFSVVKEIFWDKPTSLVMRKTAGIQALFQLFKFLVGDFLKDGDVSLSAWRNALQRVGGYDFSNAFFSESSGRGRSRIYTALLVLVGRMQIDQVRDDLFRQYLKNTVNSGERVGL